MQKENEATETDLNKTELKTKTKAADSKPEQQKTKVCKIAVATFSKWPDHKNLHSQMQFP